MLFSANFVAPAMFLQANAVDPYFSPSDFLQIMRSVVLKSPSQDYTSGFPSQHSPSSKSQHGKSRSKDQKPASRRPSPDKAKSKAKPRKSKSKPRRSTSGSDSDSYSDSDSGSSDSGGSQRHRKHRPEPKSKHRSASRKERSPERGSRAPGDHLTEAEIAVENLRQSHPSVYTALSQMKRDENGEHTI